MAKNRRTRKYDVTFSVAIDKETLEMAISLALEWKTSRSEMIRILVKSAYDAQLGRREKHLLKEARRGSK